MKKLFGIVALLALLVSCTKVPEGETGFKEGVPVDLVIPFGCADSPLTFATKSSLGLEPESQVYNLYVFIFDSAGKKFYGKYFDHTNLSTTGVSTLSDWWEVSNNYKETSTSDPVTSGAIHIHTVSKSGCTLVAIANIDAEMVNISPEQLGLVNKYSDLYDQKAKLNQLIVSRSGYFPMSGETTGVNINAADPDNTVVGSVTLRRLDAKIMFKVRVEPGSKIASFKPEKWRVVNIPKRAYILERGEYKTGVLSAADQAALVDATGDSDDDYFDLPETNFETETVTDDFYSGSTINQIGIHGFSFYMMENRKAPVKTPAAYADRERQVKLNPYFDGTYATVTNGDFEYANKRSTYVVITGHVQMDNVSYGEITEGATLSADVQYIVHLGDFSDDKWGDFNVFRNHTYIYDIVIRDVADIRAEVEHNYDDDLDNNIVEKEPGASGNVSVAMEEVFTSDAHYSSHVVTFHAKYIDANKVTWVVETPFNPEGASPVMLADGTENTAGIDFEWVEFRVNDKDEAGNYYDQRRQIYLPRTGPNADGKTMNISGLVAYLKKQKNLYDSQKPSDFDNDVEKNEDGSDKLENGHTIANPKISVTAFVNEYYYERNPITGDYQRDLWKKFVNQPMRYMHILSETKTSADGGSQIVGASFTIQQESIQTIYNISNLSLQSAWGCEHVQDAMEAGLGKYNVNTNYEDRGNTSLTNGRLNTMKEWGLLDKNGTKSIMGDVTEDAAHWDNYLLLTAENETPIMLSKYQYLRYSCMSRNRDNNGNGVIDEDEVRWYAAASNQLIGLFLGGYGIEGDARLYQRSAKERLSDDRETWRQHVIASTRYPGRTNSNNNARVIWAEEGLTGSDISFTNTNDGATTTFSTRCVRNLGYDPVSDGDFSSAPRTSEPENYILVRRLRDGAEYPVTDPVSGKTNSYDKYVYYEFDCSRLNTASLRYYTDRELVSHDENHEAACLYKKFVVASKAESETNPIPDKLGSYNPRYINQMNAYLDSPANIGGNPFCPSGYRLCNVREDAVIWSFTPSGDLSSFLTNSNGGTFMNHTRTHWSFGESGVNNKHLSNKSWGWTISKDKIIMANVNKSDQQTLYLRCVKDVKD